MRDDFQVCSVGMRIDLDARRRHGEQAPPPSWPAAVVPCRLAGDVEMSRTAWSVRFRAQEHGWTVVATYARGYRPIGNPKSWTPGELVDSLCLRMRRTVDGRMRAAVACWADGAFAMAVDIGGLRKLGYRELLVWLTESC
jgi:hypothetical protein